MARRLIPGVDYDERVYHRPPSGPSNLRVGLLSLGVVATLVFLAFSKGLPFRGHGFELTAQFENAATLRVGSPVRIAGVVVGRINSLQRDGELAAVTFDVDRQGLPIHADASITLRPRLFLEGNVFLDLKPGSPSAPALADGDSISAARTTVAVQLDQVLAALQAPTRDQLSALLEGFGTALSHRPSAADDRGQDAAVQGESAAEALNDSFRYGARAGRSTAQVNQALLGTEPDDLGRLISSGGKVFRTVADHEAALRGLISNLDTTAGAFAAESQSLREGLRQLAPTLEVAKPALADLNDSLPPLRSFAAALRPAINELPATIAAGTPWLRQAYPLLGRAELGGLSANLAAAAPDLSLATRSLGGLFGELEPAARCTSEVLIPTADTPISDDFTTGVENYKEFFYALVNQNSAAQEFDGNGQYLRVQVATGTRMHSTPNLGGGVTDDVLYSFNPVDTVGTQPTLRTAAPAIKPTATCYRQMPPDLNGPAATIGAPSPEPVP